MARQKTKRAKVKPWTSGDEDSLIANVRKSSDNLRKAFEQTSKEIQRSPNAIASHWYTHTSIRSNHVLFFKMSGDKIFINRSRGKGKVSNLPLYKKILLLLGLSY